MSHAKLSLAGNVLLLNDWSANLSCNFKWTSLSKVSINQYSTPSNYLNHERVSLPDGIFTKCTLLHMHNYRGQIQRKTWRMGPYAGVDYNLTLCTLQSRLLTHLPWATPCHESTLTLSPCQSRLYPLSGTLDLASVNSHHPNALSTSRFHQLTYTQSHTIITCGYLYGNSLSIALYLPREVLVYGKPHAKNHVNVSFSQ
jgi:hypothetical protein